MNLNQKLEERKKNRMNKTKEGFFKPEREIEDHYQGTFKEKIETKKVLDEQFLEGLKLADVPDSDDECYF